MKSISIIILIVILFSGCSDPVKQSTADDVAKGAEIFRQNLLKEKVSPDFLHTLGLTNQQQIAKLTTMGKPIPVIEVDFSRTTTLDSLAEIAFNPQVDFFLVPNLLDSTQVSVSYYRTTTKSTTAALISNCGDVLVKERNRQFLTLPNGGGTFPVGVVTLGNILTDFEQIDIQAFKTKDNLYFISLMDSFYNEKEDNYQLQTGKVYGVEDVRQIFKNNLDMK
jgi:hypothetical protein